MQQPTPHSPYNFLAQSHVIEELLRLEHVSEIRTEDYPAFMKYFGWNVPLVLGEYRFSWSYLTQAAHMESVGCRFGLKYMDSQTLIVLGAFVRPNTSPDKLYVHLVAPMGEWQPDLVFDLAHRASAITGTPTYVKKIHIPDSASLLERGALPVDNSKWQWHPAAPIEDDSYPERIIDLARLEEVLQNEEAGGFASKYRNFQQTHGEQVTIAKLDQSNAAAALTIVNEFFGPEYGRPSGMSEPADYYNMISASHPANDDQVCPGKVMYLRETPVGLFVGERIPAIGQQAAVGVYANLALYRRAPNSADYLLAESLRLLYREGIRYANLGGSETAPLDRFKDKYARKCNGTESRLTWVVILPQNTARAPLPTQQQVEPDERAKRESRPRSVAMMIFINVVLGIALWQAISSCMAGDGAAIPDGGLVEPSSRSLQLGCLLAVFATNLLRTFLGFVSFDVNCGLSEKTINERWLKKLGAHQLLLWLRTGDFIVGALAATLLIPLSSKCDDLASFAAWFVGLSVLFVVRNAVLYWGYYHKEVNNDNRWIRNRRATQSWFYIDTAFLLVAITWMILAWIASKDFTRGGILVFFAACLVVLSAIDVYLNMDYYFSDADKDESSNSEELHRH